ncbi:MAG: type I-E CRISPR-associated protein Cse1/CasA, partial [Limisphaera sp.]|nr:type I-E CRISPR-associated protein Cse1/CasA [Limisphaera sp.]
SELARQVDLFPRLRVLGQVSDQAKVLDIRREVYPLPRDLVGPRGEVLLQKALELAEGLGEKLQGVTRRLAQALLGGRDPAELQAFQRSLPLLRLYWAELDGAFPRFLEGLEGLGSLDGWRDELRRAAQGAWGETRRFLGTEGRHLKALAEGERAFGQALTFLKEEVKG